METNANVDEKYGCVIDYVTKYQQMVGNLFVVLFHMMLVLLENFMQLPNHVTHGCNQEIYFIH